LPIDIAVIRTKWKPTDQHHITLSIRKTVTATYAAAKFHS